MNAPIIPPPDLRNIVDKTATFVARNGPEFETRIQLNEQNNPKFNFLKPGDPYNAYYQFKVREIRESGNQAPISQVNGTSNRTSNNTTQQQQANEVQSKLIKSFADKVQIKPNEPPPEYEFMIEPPSVLALDLDIIKLTAQFVAIHGRSFLTNLMNKEQRNYQFDFLRPQHGLFSYFSQLTEQYAKIINQEREILIELDKELDPDYVWKKINYRLEWTKIEEAKKKRVEEEIERERVQYAQIDWHDFVIVETVDYQSNEQGIFPPPTTPEQVGSRILIQQRIEEEQNALTGKTANEIDDKLDNKIELKDDKKSANKIKEQEDKEIMPPPILTDNIVIRKDYDPKQSKKQSSSTNTKDGYFVSPFTNEKIPAEKLPEHMRFALLDSKWREEKEKSIQERLQQEEVYAQGPAIESSLKQMAERRTDIFGSGIDEIEIGKKFGEEELSAKQTNKVTWDGYSNTMESATKKARASITIEEQIQQIHKVKGLVEEDNKDKIGPAIVPTSINQQSNTSIISSNASIQQLPVTNKVINKLPVPMNQQTATNRMPFIPSHPNPAAQFPPSINNPMINPHLYHPAIPQMPHPNLIPTAHQLMPNQPHQLAPNLQSHHFIPHPPGLPTDPTSILAAAVTGNNLNTASMGAMDSTQEPATKKQRTEDNFIPELEWMATHSGLHQIIVKVPNRPEVNKNLNGQIIQLKLQITDPVSKIKDELTKRELEENKKEDEKLPLGKLRVTI